MRPEPAPVLSGTRILVTARRRGAELAQALRERGADVLLAPTLELVDLPEAEVLRATHALLADPPDVVVVLTAEALRRWLAVAARAGLADDVVRLLAGARVVARGPKAGRGLAELGVATDWLAEADTSEELGAYLRTEGVAGQLVAVVHGGTAAPLVDRVQGLGGRVVTVEPYRCSRRHRRAEVRSAVAEVGAGAVDAVLLTSAPGAEAWLRVVQRDGLLEPVRDLVDSRRLLLGAVGPLTAAPLGYAGLLARVPESPRLAALVRLVLAELGDDRHALVTGHGRLRLRAGAMTLDHRPVALPPSGLALLRRLASTPGHVVSREELLRVLPGASTDPHAAEVAVARLREALREATGDAGLVRTVVRRGYVLAAR